MTYTKTNLNETTETVVVDMTAEDIENNEATETVVEQNARGYSKTVWNESTPITADKLNKMETGIANGIDKTEQIMEIPINHPDGWQQFRWTKPGATTISWTRDVSRRKAFEVYDENAYKPLLLLNDDGVLTTSGNLVSQGNLAFSNYGGGGLSSNIHSLALHAATGNGQLMNVSTGNTIYVGNPNTQLTIESSSNPIVNIGPNVYQLYHTGNKPTAGDVGALPLTGGTLTGNLSIAGNSNGVILGTGGNDVYIKNSASNSFLQLKDNGNLTYNDNIIYHGGNFNPATKLDAGNFSINNRDLCIYGKRALVGFNTPDGNYLSINHDTDFGAGVAIHGLTVVDKIENSGNLVFSKIGGGGINACIANSALNAATGNGQMLNVGVANTIHVGNPNTPLYIESSSNPIVHVGGGAHALLHSGSLTQKMRFGGYSADRWDNSQIEINAGLSGGIARLNFHREGQSQMSIVHKVKDQLHVEYDNGAQKRILTDGDPCARLSWDGSRISIDGGRNNAAVSLADTSEVARHIHNSHTGRNFKFRADAGLGPLEGEITFTW